jgi:hypothetical protein
MKYLHNKVDKIKIAVGLGQCRDLYSCKYAWIENIYGADKPGIPKILIDVIAVLEITFFPSTTLLPHNPKSCVDSYCQVSGQFSIC